MPNLRAHRSRSAYILLMLAATGCYVQEPVDPRTVAPGSPLLIALSPTGQERLGEFSSSTSREVAGRLLLVTPDSLTLDAALSASPAISSSLRQTFTFGYADMERVTSPELHLGRTAAVVAGALAVAGMLIAQILDIGDGTGIGSSPPSDGGAPFRPHP